MYKCKKCGATVPYLKYFCTKCRKEKAGVRPRKSKGLCSGCNQDWYNHHRPHYGDSRKTEKGEQCWSYKGAKVIRKNVYYSSSTIIPTVEWRLSCFNYKRN